MTVHPDYVYWSEALKGNLGPVHDGDAQCGFYRRRLYKDGPFVPVAIWRGEDGNLVALVDQKAADAADIWTWVCDKPITEAQYRAVVAGKRWHDEPPAPAISNMPADPFEALKIELAAEQEIAAEYLKAPVTTQDQANQIAVLTKRLSGLKSRATDLHKVEKQPFLDGGRKVDDKWRDLKEEPDTLSKKLKRHLDAYLQEQQRQENERRRKAQEEADRIRREAEEAARQASAANDEAARAEAERLEQEAAAKAKEAEARNASAGRTGARVALRTFVSAQVTDYYAAAKALLDADHPEFKATIDQLANRAIKAGVPLAGVERVEEQRAA